MPGRAPGITMHFRIRRTNDVKEIDHSTAQVRAATVPHGRPQVNNARRKDVESIIKLLRDAQPVLDDAKGKVEDTANAEREYYDNMPENMQSGDRGQQADNAATQLEEVQQALDEFDVEELIGKLEDALQ